MHFNSAHSTRATSPRPAPAPPQVGRGTSRLQSSSAHADGGAAGVKKRLSLAARHRFFGQAPKKWGRKAGQGNDHLPTYRRTRTNVKKWGNPRRGFPLRPPPALYEHKRVPRSAERGQGLCPWTLPPLKRRAKLSFALRAAKGDSQISYQRISLASRLSSKELPSPR